MSSNLASRQNAVVVTERELCTILAALRLYQMHLDAPGDDSPRCGRIDGEDAEYVQDLASNLGTYSPLTVQEVDGLCLRIHEEPQEE